MPSKWRVVEVEKISPRGTTLWQVASHLENTLSHLEY